MGAEYGVIFDMDGVLVDSFHAHFASWREAAALHSLEITQEQFAATFGRTSREIIAERWGPETMTPAEMQDFDRRKEASFRRIVEREFPAMDGARELIASLAQSGFRLAIGSSGPPENVELVVSRLQIGPHIAVRITGADVTRGKPDPEVFLLAAERMGLAPARCAVIEDAPVGIEAALRAGMTGIGFASTGRTVASLAAAAWVIQSLRELSPVVIARRIDERTQTSGP